MPPCVSKAGGCIIHMTHKCTRKPSIYRVAVLHPMPPGASPTATRALQLGQHLKREDLSPHPVLGSIGEQPSLLEVTSKCTDTRAVRVQGEGTAPRMDATMGSMDSERKTISSYQDTIVVCVQ